MRKTSVGGVPVDVVHRKTMPARVVGTCYAEVKDALFDLLEVLNKCKARFLKVQTTPQADHRHLLCI
jgi:hypothetical protein